jgi:glycerol transport system ATP-binding protein
MNLMLATRKLAGVELADGTSLSLALPETASAALTLGLRASAVRVERQPGDTAFAGRVELAEISGSDTFVHVATAVGNVVAQLTGVHYFDLGATIEVFVNPAQMYVFDAQGQLLLAPLRKSTRAPLHAGGH